MDEKYWRNLEKLFVHHVYDEISPYYSRDNDDNTVEFCTHSLEQRQSSLLNTHHNAWRKVKTFLLELEPHSLVADIGCGNGKYLNLNPSLYTIGCDICSFSVNIASNQSQCKNQLLVCDNLNLPFRSEMFDAVISIGVIHHFSTQKRRGSAIRELCRILKPGGKLMIYVWAYEQVLRKFDSQDVLVPSIKNSQSKIKRNRHFSECTLSEKNDPPASTQVKPTRTLHQSISIDENCLKTPPTSIAPTAKPKLTHRSNSNSIMSTITTFLSRRLSSTSVNSTDNLRTNNIKDNELSEYYNRLLEINKTLPKEFQIRKFPESSCVNTFDETEMVVKEKSEFTTTPNTNYTLKRYYHVFKANELDVLINETVDDMYIYKSYYDRGNWCVCAQKKY